jgi:hypothetical protein
VAAIDIALTEQVEHLASRSDSFSLPAIRKWARMLTDERNPKAWPRVFADGRFLLRALVSTYESVTEGGIFGGNLRRLFVEFLAEAARLIGRDLEEPAHAYRQAAAAWERFAATCLSAPVVKQVVDLDARRWSAVAKGDAGWEEAASAGASSNALLQGADTGLDASEQVRLFAEMAEALLEVHRAEVTAHAALAGSIS